MQIQQQRRTKRTGAIIKVVAAVFLIAAACIIGYDFPSQQPSPGTREFFTDDDGATWFADDGTKVAPFDHNGKPAVLARVFETKGGKQFVGYLMKFSDEARKKIVEAQTTHRLTGGASAATEPVFDGLLVKRPHQTQWISDSDPNARAVKIFAGPDGSKDFVPVRP